MRLAKVKLTIEIRKCILAFLLICLFWPVYPSCANETQDLRLQAIYGQYNGYTLMKLPSLEFIVCSVEISGQDEFDFGDDVRLRKEKLSSQLTKSAKKAFSSFKNISILDYNGGGSPNMGGAKILAADLTVKFASLRNEGINGQFIAVINPKIGRPGQAIDYPYHDYEDADFIMFKSPEEFISKFQNLADKIMTDEAARLKIYNRQSAIGNSER